MNKTTTLLSLALLFWIAGSSYWYMCKVKDYCCSEKETTEIAKTPVKPVKSTKVEQNTTISDTLVLSELHAVYYFDFAKSDYKLNQTEKDYISEIQAYLKKYPNTKIVIKGYADSNGSETANTKFSKLRAASIKKLLVNSGINHQQINMEYFGSDKLITSSNNTVENMRLSRRVELNIVTKQ